MQLFSAAVVACFPHSAVPAEPVPATVPGVLMIQQMKDLEMIDLMVCWPTLAMKVMTYCHCLILCSDSSLHKLYLKYCNLLILYGSHLF